MTDLSLNRRVLLGSAAAAAATAGTLKLTSADAQDSTPVAAGAASASPAASPVAYTDLPTVPPEYNTPTNWPAETGNLKGTRAAEGSNISTSTISNLTLAWSKPIVAAGQFGALTANPTVVDGVIYLQSGVSDVYAFDLETGDIKWQKTYNQQVPSGGPNGIAVAYGNAFYPVGGQGQVVAVDAATGDDIWSTFIAGPRKEGIDMAPVVYGGVLYISTIPGNVDGYYQGGQRGVIHGLDVTTGEVLWYFDTTTDNLWGNALVNSGGGLWHPPVFDDDGYSYYGIGNAAPYPGTKEFPNASSRPGDNLYTNSILKIDPSRIGLEWYHSVSPHDLFDLDNHLSPVLTTLKQADGSPRNIAITSGKHGFVVAVDAAVGEEIWRTPVGKHQNEKLDAIPDGEEIEVYPGTFGGVETPIAVANDLVFAPIINSSTWYTPTSLDATKLNFSAGTGQLYALSVLDGSVVWSKDFSTAALGSATVANDVVFTGTMDGVFRAFNTKDGSDVWSYQTTSGISAGPAISGDYVVLASGGLYNAGADNASPVATPTAALYVFKLNS